MDEAKTKTLVDALRGGVDIRTAAQFAGLNYVTVYRWVERGQRENERIEAGAPPNEEEAQFVKLWQALRKARAEAVVRNVAQIQKAAQQGEWKAAAWWLERTVPEFYAKQRQDSVAEARSEELSESPESQAQ